MNIIALINNLLSNNAAPIDANASEDHAGDDRSIGGFDQGGVDQGSIGFEFVTDRNEGSSDESAGSATPIDVNASGEHGGEECSSDGDEQASVGFEFVTDPYASCDESSSVESASGSSGGDNVSYEDFNQEAGDLQDCNENVPPTNQ